MPSCPSLPYALSLALLVAPTLGAQRLEYALGTTSYRLTTSTTGTQVSPMGTQQFDLSVEQRLTVTVVRRAADTLVATITIDSISLRGADPAPDVGRYRGSVFLTVLSPAGRVYASKGPEGADALLAQLTEAVARFLPTYRGILAPGAIWSDTTAGKVVSQGVEVDRTIVADYLVGADSSFAGQTARTIRRRTTMKAAGRGNANGSEVALETGSRGESMLYLSREGVYLGSTSSDDIDLTLTIIAANAGIVVRQKSTQRVEAIR